MKRVLLASFIAMSSIVNAGEAEIRMSQKMIDINNGSLSCGKVVKAEKIQDTSKFLDVMAICSNGEIYRMGVIYGKARDVKVAISCSKPFTGWAKEAAQEMNITLGSCKNPKA